MAEREPAQPTRAEDAAASSQATADATMKPLVRGNLVLSLAVLASLAIGYYGGRCVRSAVGWPGRKVSTAATADSVQAAPAPVPAALRSFDPDAAPPATVDALVHDAIEVADALVAMYPDSADALEIKARTLVWLGKHAEAVANWEACLKLDPNYAHALIGMARSAASRADHEEALARAQHAIDIDASSFQARTLAAEALLQLGRAAEVPAVLEEHLKSDARSLGYFLLGQAYAQMERHQEAATNYEAATRLYADYTEAYNGLALAYQRLGETEKAQQAMAKFRELGAPERMAARVRGATASDLELMQRDAAVLYTDAGRVLYVHDQMLDAERLWLRAARLDPHNTGCRQSLAFLCRNAKRRGEQIVWLEELAALEPHNLSYWIEIGRTYEDLEIMPAAEKAYRSARDSAPESAAGCVALADLLLRYERQLPEALELAGEAVQRRPSAANYAMLSAARRLTSDLPGAREAIEKAIELAPQNPAYQAVHDAIVNEMNE